MFDECAVERAGAVLNNVFARLRLQSADRLRRITREQRRVPCRVLERLGCDELRQAVDFVEVRVSFDLRPCRSKFFVRGATQQKRIETVQFSEEVTFRAAEERHCPSFRRFDDTIQRYKRSFYEFSHCAFPPKEFASFRGRTKSVLVFGYHRVLDRHEAIETG